MKSPQHIKAVNSSSFKHEICKFLAIDQLLGLPEFWDRLKNNQIHKQNGKLFLECKDVFPGIDDEKLNFCLQFDRYDSYVLNIQPGT